MKNTGFNKIFAMATIVITCFSMLFGNGITSYATNSYSLDEPIFGNYFNSDYSTREEVLAANRELNREIAGEGLVLLKNEDSLPIGGDLKISVFGKNSVRVMSGGSRSGAGGGVPITGFIDALKQEGFSVNPTLVNFYMDQKKSGSGRGKAPGNGSVSPGYNTGETPVANYTEDIEATYEAYGDAAVVVFSRISGEGFDLPRTMMWNGSTYKSWGTDATQPVPGARDKYDHYLQLDQNESDLLKYLGEHFDNVIVLLNTGSQFEVGFLDDPGHYGYHENVKGCIWMGYPGSSGNVAVAKALKGEINPSGRTVDTWARDFKNDPTWQNFGNNLMECYSAHLKGNEYANNPPLVGSGVGRQNGSDYVIYKEGIYAGYRYYETRSFTEGTNPYISAGKGKADVVYNQVTGQNVSLSNDKDGDNEIHGTTTTEWDSWYNASVVYPFGYGLSYTTFEWEMVNSSAGVISADSTIAVQVKVTNTGDVAGKEVVELYYTAPYTAGGIEKAHVVLGNFAKTKLLQPGESEIVTIEITARDMSSYDWNDANKNGFKGYELENGTYELKIMKDAHTVVDSFNCVVNEGITYQYSETTGYKIENRFDDISNYLLTDEYAYDGVGYMSRADFAGTFPKMAYKINESQWVMDAVSELRSGADDSSDKPWYTDVMPTTGANNGIMLQDLIGVEYNDPKWDLYMDQFTAKQLADLAMNGSYASGQNYPELGVTRVPNASGAAGWLYGSPSGTYSTWCSETVLASTWNTSLARAKGVGMGNEALWGNGSQNIPFWYAPSVNIHRSPFSGRNFEHFSEDGLFSGIMAAAMIDGAQSKGLICYVGHFAVNDQESNRCGLITWLDEQSMREIYIKPWEVCVKEANTIGIMTSLNRIGTCWAGGSYELITEILRDEWGFKGSVVTDSYSASWSNADMMIRAGGNLALGNVSASGLKAGYSSATAVSALRNAAKGILYSHANSMAMNTGDYPTKPPTLDSYAPSTLNTAFVSREYSASVANAVINTVHYPDAKPEDVVYTLKEGSVLPEGLVLNPDGTITGVPTVEDIYTKITVVATLLDYQKEAVFIIEVANKDGTIVYSPTSTELTNAIIGKEYQANIAEATVVKPDDSTADSQINVTYSLADGSSLPKGLTLSPDGIISGIPTFECENYEFTVVASAFSFEDKSVTYSISVYHNLTFEASELEIGRFNEDYIASVAMAQCNNEVTYSLKKGSALPKGLTLSKNGYITGKPLETVTDYKFTVVASSSYAQDVEVTFSISIGLNFDDDKRLADGLVGGVYSASVSAEGADNIKYRIKEGSVLPEGLGLNENGKIVGTPKKAGIYHFTVVAESEGKIGDEIKLTIVVYSGQATSTPLWQSLIGFIISIFNAIITFCLKIIFNF